jgi:hypothetical protein
MMKNLKLKLARLFCNESAARCKARVKREIKLLYEAGTLNRILHDGEYGYMRNYL